MLLVVLSRTLELARNRFGTLFAAGWGYMLLLLALNLAISGQLMPETGFSTGSYMMEPLAGAAAGDDRERALRILAGLANIATGFSIAVAYLRRILLGERAFPLAFGARNLRVAWKLLLLGVLSGVFFVPMLLVAGLLLPVMAPAGFVLMLASPFLTVMLVQRLSLVLPAAALDDRMSLGESWRLTAGIGWALVLAALVVALLAALVSGLWVGLVWLVGEAFVPATGLAAELRSALVPMGVMVIVTWLFASMHATAYALTRERFVEQVGLKIADAERAAERRAEAGRDKARQAVRSVIERRSRRD